MCAVSIALVVSSWMKTGAAFATMPAVQAELLESVSLVVVSVAIIDVAKYILEEEVFGDRELREPAEAREAITKFIVVIALVIAIESIVFIFNLGHSEPQGLVFPSLLLLIFVGMIVGLGLYQKLSLGAERELQSMPPTDSEDDESPRAEAPPPTREVE
jgi:preprotein translocase subunit SecE